MRLLPALMVAAALSARAETPVALDWEAGVREATAGNPELRAARANLDAAGYNEQGAYSGYLPQLSAGTSYTDTSGSATLPTTTTTGLGSSYSASVSLSQNLFSGFQDRARIDQGAANREASEVNLTAAKAKLSQDIKTAFAGLKYAQDNVTLTASIVRRLEENVRLVELRFESGRENKGSFLLTKASLAQARYEHLQAGQALTSGQAQLAKVLGRGEPGELEVRGEVPLSEPDTTPDFRRLVLQAPDFRQAAAQEKSAVAGVTLARSGFYPNLSLSGSVSRAGSDWFPEAERRSVGVNLTVPLYSGGKDYFATKSAVSSLEVAASNRDSAERQLLVRLKQAYAGYVESTVKLKVDGEFFEAATARAEIARSKYNNGLMSFDDWDRIETDLIQRSKNLLQSQRDRVAAEAAWEQAQGKGVIQ